MVGWCSFLGKGLKLPRLGISTQVSRQFLAIYQFIELLD